MARPTLLGRGRLVRYADLHAVGNARLQWLFLLAAGLESEDLIHDTYLTPTTLLAAANDEVSNPGYARQNVTGLTITPDTTLNKNIVTCSNPSITLTGGTMANIGAAALIFNPDITAAGQGAANDANCALLFIDVFTTPVLPVVNVALPYAIPGTGFYQAA